MLSAGWQTHRKRKADSHRLSCPASRGNEECKRPKSTPCPRQFLCSLKLPSPPYSNLGGVLNGWDLGDVSTEFFYPLDFGWVHPERGTSQERGGQKNIMIFVPSCTSPLALLLEHGSLLGAVSRLLVSWANNWMRHTPKSRGETKRQFLKRKIIWNQEKGKVHV